MPILPHKFTYTVLNLIKTAIFAVVCVGEFVPMFAHVICCHMPCLENSWTITWASLNETWNRSKWQWGVHHRDSTLVLDCSEENEKEQCVKILNRVPTDARHPNRVSTINPTSWKIKSQILSRMGHACKGRLTCEDLTLVSRVVWDHSVWLFAPKVKA